MAKSYGFIIHSLMEVSNPRSILDFDAHGFNIINYKTTQFMNKLNDISHNYIKIKTKSTSYTQK